MAQILEQMRIRLQKKVVAIKEDVEKIMETASGQNVPPELVKRLNQLNQTIGENFEV